MFATYRTCYHLLHQQPNFLHSHVNYNVQVSQIKKDYLVHYLKKNNIDLSTELSILRSPDDARLTEQRKGNTVQWPLFHESRFHRRTPSNMALTYNSDYLIVSRQQLEQQAIVNLVITLYGSQLLKVLLTRLQKLEFQYP